MTTTVAPEAPAEINHAALMIKARRVVLTVRRLIDAAAKLQDGPWSADWDSCDCGDGYGCSHGSFVSGVYFPNPTSEIPEGREVSDCDRHESTELPTEVVEYLLLWQLDTGRAVLAMLEGVLDAYNAAPVEQRGNVCGPLGWGPIAAIVDSLHKSREYSGQWWGAYGEGEEQDPIEWAEHCEYIASFRRLRPGCAESHDRDAAESRAKAAAHLAAVKAGGAV